MYRIGSPAKTVVRRGLQKHGTNRCHQCRNHLVDSGGIRGKTTSSTSSSTANNSTPVTAQDLQALHHELRALQDLIKQNKSQTYHVETLTRNVAAKTAHLETTLQTMSSHVSRISVVEKLVTSVNDFLQNHPAVQGILRNFETVVHKSTPFLKHYKYAILPALAVVIILWKYRSALVYERTSEEVADLARLTLEQESLQTSIQETLRTLANNPSTLQTLNDLVQKLVTHKRTEQDLVNLLVHAVNTPEVQNALLDLLQVVFKDPHLQKLTGEFLLKGLNMEHVKQMLDDQTAQLVRDTVADDSVQQATAVGLQRSVWYAVTPSILWRFMEHNKKKDDTITQQKDSKEQESGNEQHKVRDIQMPNGNGIDSSPSGSAQDRTSKEGRADEGGKNDDKEKITHQDKTASDEDRENHPSQ